MEELIFPKNLCTNCGAEISKSDSKFCVNCGFPHNGTEKEKALFHANRVLKKNAKSEAAKKVQSAKKTLFWMAGIFFVVGLFYFFRSQDPAILITNALLALIFLGLAFWAQTKPFAALLSALLLYIMIIVLNAVLEPMTIIQGILFKVIVITLLGKGVYSAQLTDK